MVLAPSGFTHSTRKSGVADGGVKLAETRGSKEELGNFGFRASGLGFRASGLGFRASGFGFRGLGHPPKRKALTETTSGCES